MLSLLFAVRIAWLTAQAPVSDVPASSTDSIPATRLVYLPGRFAEGCPTEVEVQEGIARRIGRSPFHEPATRIVVLSLDGDGAPARGPARAKTELFDMDLASLGARSLESGGGCGDLVETAELAVSIALAPSLALGEKLPVPVEERVAEPLAVEGRLVDVPAAPKASLLPPGVVVLLGASANASLLVGPQDAVGAGLSVAVRADQVELRFERREHLPGFDGSLGVVHGAGAFTVAPCGHLPLFTVLGRDDNAAVTACGTATLGEVWALGFGTGAGGYVGGSPFASTGLRLGVEWTQRDFTSLRAWSQVELYVVKPSFFAFNGASPWAQDAPVNVTFGLTYEIPWSI